MKKKYVLAICGASGSIYGLRLLQVLMAQPVAVHLTISPAALQVMGHEHSFDGGSLEDFLNRWGIHSHDRAELYIHEAGNLFAPPASGSFIHQGMVIAPCSMKTLAAVAGGLADDLIHRSADVCLKEKRPLILLTRETPLSLIHIQNMQRITRSGALVMPASPAFYTGAETILDLVDTVVGRVLDHLHIDHQLISRWGNQKPEKRPQGKKAN